MVPDRHCQNGSVLVLGVDTVTAAVTAVLGEVTDHGVRVLDAEVTVDARGHGERLAPAIDAVLRRTGRTPGDLAAVVAGTGPGPFTGLRVGMVTATAMAQALNIPVYGVCSLDAIGAAAGPGRVLVATDARRREVYWAVYTDGTRDGDPAVDAPAHVAAVAHADRTLGEGALRYPELLGEVSDGSCYPVPHTLLALAAPRITTAASTETLEPRYLRRPDAVAPGARKPVR
jgi:tRNA threonylcarbamoyladenosine biosynthesis protein TsaB